MTLQTDIFGGATFSGTTKKEVEEVLEKFPAAMQEDQTALFYFLCLRTTCPWICQIPTEKQNDLKNFLRSLGSLRRRRQEYMEGMKAGSPSRKEQVLFTRQK